MEAGRRSLLLDAAAWLWDPRTLWRATSEASSCSAPASCRAWDTQSVGNCVVPSARHVCHILFCASSHPLNSLAPSVTVTKAFQDALFRMACSGRRR